MDTTGKSATPQSHSWPKWDESLGVAPIIIHGVLPRNTEPSYDERLSVILSNIVEAAAKPQANALREQLKSLSGVQIDIRQGQENEVAASKWISVRGHEQIAGDPYIQFNPDLWQRYPVADAVKRSAPHLESRSLLDETGAIQMPLTIVPATFDRYGIAPPEQLLLHALARYAYFEKAYRQEVSAKKPGVDPQLAADWWMKPWP